MPRHGLAAALAFVAALVPRPSPAAQPPSAGARLEPVVEFAHDRPTAVAVTAGGRVFVSLPYSSHSDPATHAATVVEVAGGVPRPYPDAVWNGKDGGNVGARLLNVQSLTLAADGFLWLLDTGSPRRAGVVPGGAKLVKVDPATDRVVQVVALGPPAVRAESYLNDVRVDAVRQVAYVTDSVRGGIIVVDLAAGTARMVLEGPPPPCPG